MNIITKKKIDSAEEKVELAQKFADEEIYARCLHKASLAKAEATSILSLIGVGNETISDLIERKIDAAKASISRQIKKGTFPVIGYSYYEYAISLKDKDKHSALLFSDYALELSNPGLRFKSEEPVSEAYQSGKDKNGRVAPELAYFILGIVTGVVLATAFVSQKKRGEVLRRSGKKPRKTVKRKKDNK